MGSGQRSEVTSCDTIQYTNIMGLTSCGSYHERTHLGPDESVSKCHVAARVRYGWIGVCGGKTNTLHIAPLH